ncbi:MAG: uncharacterized Zn finger protein (UPF0148 family) [Halobacteriales archaeon]|jgi:uncharacterized Zn finger protein (UPF0148 family)
MSEDFDKEAEREKLREQFERDEQRRQASRKMSDLLLKGATMTNKHCDQCGNPIFRYEGQEFCAECQTVMGGEGEATGESREAPRSERGESELEAQPDSTVESPTESAGDPDSAPEAAQGQESGSGPTERKRSESDFGHPTVRPDETPQPREPASRGERAVKAARNSSSPDSGDLASAQVSLQETLTRFANRAAETDDPRQAREYLAAAREAAEALAALRR